MSDARIAGGTGAAKDIELRVEHVSHLFDAFDPFPTPSRDLAQSAEDFIVGWARDLPRDAALRILIHVPDAEARETDAAAIAAAFARHFEYRAQRMSGDLAKLFRIGRRSLAIGLGVLALCIVAGRGAQTLMGDTYIGHFFGEGLIIVGWVANWRPIEIFLYEWWPISRRQRLFQRLAAAPVALRARSAAPPAS